MHEAATRTADTEWAAASPAFPLRWPPPGLETTHGAMWPAAAQLAAGGAIMTVPLLWAVARAQPFWSTGAFGSSWWLPLAAAVLGLLLVLGAVDRLARLLLTAGRAAGHGYSWRVIAAAATDYRRDAGFLLQGLRQYAALEERERRWLLDARIVAAVACLLMLLWVPFAFGIGLLLAGSGGFDSGTALTAFVLVPAVMLLLASVGGSVLDSAVTARVRHQWRRKGGGDDEVRADAEAWMGAWEARALPASPQAARAPLRAAAWVLVAATVLLSVPVLTVTLVSAAGPLATHMATPLLGTGAPLARIEMLRPYALPHDPSITPRQAGEALHVLAFSGSAAAPRGPLELSPVRSYGVPWGAAEDDDPPATLSRAELLRTDPFERARSLTADERAYLERLSAHPAHAEFAVLARAGAADLAGTRWDGSLLPATSMFELPIPRLGGLRNAAEHRTLLAALQMSRGELGAAETTLRETLSTGLLVATEGVFMIDVLFGSMIADRSARSLLQFYEATGRTAEAATLSATLAGIDATQRVTRSLRPGHRLDGTLASSMSQAGDDVLPRGMRWEALHLVHTMAGCVNPHNAVFGTDEHYAQWIDGVRKDLVRYPADEALFRAATNGAVLPESLSRRGQMVQRVVGLTLRREGARGCATLLAGISST